MPLPLSTAARNAIQAREVALAWFLELYCDEFTLRGWDQTDPITYQGQEFEPIGSTWDIMGDLRVGAGLVSESLTLSFNGGDQYDDTTFLGRLLDATWHQRRIRLRQVCFQVDSSFVTPIDTIFDWRGFMDTLDAPEGGRGPSVVTLNCESGTFRARARNLRTVTDTDQRLRDPNDASLSDIAVKPFQDVPFGVAWSTIPGAQTPSNGNATGAALAKTLWGVS